MLQRVVGDDRAKAEGGVSMDIALGLSKGHSTTMSLVNGHTKYHVTCWGAEQ